MIAGMPDISIDADMAGRRPGIHLGVLAFDVRVREGDPDFQALLDRELPSLRGMLASTELADIPAIRDARAAWKAFGVDPGRRRVSSEALLRRVRGGRAMRGISSLVDANNIVSLETGLSLGSYDAARLEGGIVFRRGRAGEEYAGIGREGASLENWPLLADALGPFGSPISDSPRAMITPETVRAITIVFSFSGAEAAEKAVALAVDRFRSLADVGGAETAVIPA